MSAFHPAIETWFSGRFGAPTPVQARAWPAIQAGGDALVMAPTGSGKTLAAFLTCLDRLVRSADSGELEDATSILYISPLKALSNDIQRNLEEPLREIGDVAEAMGLSRAPIRSAVRTGDTNAKDRRASAKRPPHVLVTTPESLFILLTSESGRKGLARVRTVIVDEIHALCADKRGAHLALSLARLDRLVVAAGGARPQRVGLSATVRPIEVAARMLVGAGRALPEVIDAGARREVDLAVEVPKDELGAVATNEQWAELYDRVATLAREHRSTIVFVNTRRLVERVAFALSQRLGEARVAAHHGSLSRARRFDAEQRLKAGDLSLIVATASLELGIDVGAVDLTCLLGSPRSIATAMQRIGRSGHALAATPKGRLFPLTRDQLLECAAIVRASRRGVIDEVAMREAPLDILSQQIVAIASAETIGEDELFALAREAAPYADLARHDFDAVIEMLSEGFALRNGRAGALIHRDAVGRQVKGRRGARIAALTSGGAIPDNANYDVVLEPDETKIGTIDEDFAVESMAGDVFLLGTSSWRIRRVETGKVRVEDAKGAAPTVPFWLGEAPARTAELSREVAALRLGIDERAEKEHFGELARGATADWLMEECALDLRGAELARDYVLAAKSALGAIPTQDTIVAERFFDEAGGMQLVVHAPFGGRINRAFGLALRKSFCRQFDFELQAAATDDGVLLSLGPQHSFPLESIFGLCRAERVEEVLTQAALQAPMFGTRWRWNATRSLALLRFRGGKRVPPPLLRMRSDDLLAAVFPAQGACQDNHGVGAPVELPDHPLVSETVRDCLTEAMDAKGLRVVLERIARGEIRCLSRESAEPSVFSHEILNANPYAFLDDAPLEERRSRAVSVRRGLPADVADRIGGLDVAAIEAVIAEAAPDPRDVDELHDLLLDLGALPEAEARRRGFEGNFELLVRARRASRLLAPSGVLWIAAERRSLGTALWPAAVFAPELVAPAGTRGASPMTREDAVAEVVRAHLGLTGPITEASLALRIGLDVSDVAIGLARVEGDGGALRGRFSSGLAPGVVEWCDRRLLARIHRRTVDRLRREVEPATAAELLRFLFVWQHVKPGGRLHGRGGLAEVIGALQGFEVAADAWEREILPARVDRYDPAMLDALCLSGEVAWGRLASRDGSGNGPTRAAAIALALRRDLPWLLTPGDPAREATLSAGALAVLGHLRQSGASFQSEIAGLLAVAPSTIEDALWELVAAGWVTSDGFGALRALLTPKGKLPASVRYASTPVARHVATGRWALLRATAASDEETLEALARQYVRRYGVVFRDLLAREPRAPAWRDLVRVYRRLEMRGELRGGRLVAGFVGEQFAAAEALEALRTIRREPPSGEIVRVSACDPLNLVGIITPGQRIPATLGNYAVYRDGVPVDVEAPALDIEAPAALGIEPPTLGIEARTLAMEARGSFPANRGERASDARSGAHVQGTAERSEGAVSRGTISSRHP